MGLSGGTLSSSTGQSTSKQSDVVCDATFLPCQFLRSKSKHVCVISLESTGAVMEIELKDPLDITRACLVCATKPVDAAVRMGDWEGGMHRKCELRVAWQSSQTSGEGGMPPPARYVRKPIRRQERLPDLKRRRLCTGT